MVLASESTVGPSSTRCEIRSGWRRAASTAIWHPIELPTSAADSMPTADIHSTTNSPIAGRSSGSGGRSLHPKPGMTGTQTRE
jgi:hypothetical protein